MVADKVNANDVSEPKKLFLAPIQKTRRYDKAKNAILFFFKLGVAFLKATDDGISKCASGIGCRTDPMQFLTVLSVMLVSMSL